MSKRFLTLTAEHNIQIVYPTTALQYFHVLRRQVLRKWRKPLVILTPKGHLREESYMNPIEEFSTGHFQRVLPDATFPGSARPDRIILATGKIAADLVKIRDQQRRDDVAIIRLEQLYPLPLAQLESAMSAYPDGTPVYWVQEEPSNMGAWYFIKINFGETFFERWPFAGKITRPESASPSTGSKKTHKIEQQELLNAALQSTGTAVTN